jgi:flagellar motility protein MotE (MotC chaperone)
MMAHIPTPRLLPLTIFALSGLLAMKSVTLVRAAVGAPDPGTAPSAAQSAAPTAPGATPGAPAPHVAAPSTPNGAARTTEGNPAAVTQPVTSPPPAMPPAPGPAPAVSDGERTVLLELRQRRQELDARETAAAAKDATLAAAELRLTARVAELESLQHKLEDLEQARVQRNDASWVGLVKLYESMKPRDAATIFNDLDMTVLLGVADRMKDAKAAPVLAAMQPDKARELTTKLAALRTKRAAVAQSN